MSPKGGDEGAEGTGIRAFTTMGKTSGKKARGGVRMRAMVEEGEGG